MHKHFSFKGPPNFTDFYCFIFQFGKSKLSLRAEWWRNWILAPLDSVGIPNKRVWSAADAALLCTNGNFFNFLWLCIDSNLKTNTRSDSKIIFIRIWFQSEKSLMTCLRFVSKKFSMTLTRRTCDLTRDSRNMARPYHCSELYRMNDGFGETWWL